MATNSPQRMETLDKPDSVTSPASYDGHIHWGGTEVKSLSPVTSRSADPVTSRSRDIVMSQSQLRDIVTSRSGDKVTSQSRDIVMSQSKLRDIVTSHLEGIVTSQSSLTHSKGSVTSQSEYRGSGTDSLVHGLIVSTVMVAILFFSSMLGIALLLTENRDVIMPEEVRQYLQTGNKSLPERRITCTKDLDGALDHLERQLEKGKEFNYTKIDDREGHIQNLAKIASNVTEWKRLREIYRQKILEKLTTFYNFTNTVASDSKYYVNSPTKYSGFYLIDVSMTNTVGNHLFSYIEFRKKNHHRTVYRVATLYAPPGNNNMAGVGLSSANSVVVKLCKGDRAQLVTVGNGGEFKQTGMLLWQLNQC